MLTSDNNRNDYLGTGTTGTYNFTFKVQDESWIEAIVRDPNTDAETTLQINTHFLVDSFGANGGTITLINGAFDWIDGSGFLDSDFILVIHRNVPLTQNADIRNQGPYFPEVHEDQFDKQVMIDIQQQEEIDSSFKLPKTVSPDDFSLELPANITERPKQLLRINETGTALELVSLEALLSEMDEFNPVNVLDNQAVPVDITGMTADASLHSSVEYLIEVARSTTAMCHVRISLFRKNGAWVIHEGGTLGDDHGLEFGVTEIDGIAQVNYLSDNSGAGLMRFKRVSIYA